MPRQRSPIQVLCLFLDQEVKTDLTTATDSRGMRYLELPARMGFVCRDGKLARSTSKLASLRLEPVRSRDRSALLLTFTAQKAFTAQKERVTVNGLPAARLSVVEPGDVLGIDDVTLYVAVRNRPFIGPPQESDLAAKCGFCRLAIQDVPDMRVYVCPSCRLPTHWQGDEVPADQRLECAKLSSQCGHCQADIVESEGFTHVPSL